MTRLVVIVAVLCSGVIACTPEDTKRVPAWRRHVEPRLTGAQWQRCSGPECGRTAAPANEPCSDTIDSHAEALTTLALQPSCTSEAMAVLRSIAHADARAFSDLAAAYYLRAAREERDSDLLLALEQAGRAVAAIPEDPAARFNLALVQEALGLHDAAAASWNTFLMFDEPLWSREARTRLNRLRAPDAASRWRRNRARLPAALKAGDGEAVARLIAPFPGLAVEMLEDGSLAHDHPADATLLASAISSRLKGDRYVLDLASGAAPREVAARIREAEGLAITDNARAAAILEPLARLARERGYEHLLARIESSHAYVLFADSQYLQSLASYDRALRTFERLGDVEKVVSIRRSKASAYRMLGQLEMSWSESLHAVRHLRQMVDTRRRQMTLMETADTAVELGQAGVALLYVEMAFALLQREFDLIRPDDLQGLAAHRNYVAAAHRARAQVELHLGNHADARTDLEEAIRLAAEASSGTATAAANIQRTLPVRIHEVTGQSLLTVDPDRAAAAFTSALAAIRGTELKTLQASLYAQRAEAERLAGHSPEADLQNALRVLRTEESQLLERRRRGEGEEYWTGYFARFDEVYDRLVEVSIEAGQWQKAFGYDERSRAYEPLDLILQHDATPRQFRQLVPDREPMTLATVRAQLPPGTVLIQYSLLGDRTHAWIVRREGVAHAEAPARREDLQRWSESVQRAVWHGDVRTVRRVLRIAYEGLLAGPLAVAEQLGPRPERIVIVPDGPMHGLPLPALYDTRAHEHLIEKAPLEIAGSATLHIFSLIRDRTMRAAAAPSALLIGDPAFDERSDFARRLERLPGALAEVEQIRHLYAPRMDVTVRTGMNATAAAFLALAADKEIIHFGGHSIVNPRRPWYSLLLLAKADGHSGAITAQELVRTLDLDRTRLVVLAACSTAGGAPVGPEGVAPLVRPLITAGVPGIVGTLWDVGDATTQTLAVSFHRRYEQGDDAAKALQAAQLDMLRNGDPLHQSVLSWAPFQVIGHASSPFGPVQQRRNGGTHLGIHRQDSVQRDDGLHPRQ